MANQKNTPLERIVTRAPEGLLLAGITGLGYFSAYLSDVGYKSYFQIPSMYAEIHLTSVVLAVCVLIFTLSIAYLCISIPEFRQYGPLLFSVLIPLALAMIIGMKVRYSLSREHFGWLVFLFLIHSVLLYLFFYLVQKQKQQTNWIAVTVLAGLLISVSYSSGTLIAKNQEYFLVSQGPSPLLIIDTYQDSMVVAPYNPKTKTITPKYRFVHLESDLNEKLSFSLKRTGPLNIKK
ncbi:hypothetical protein [Melghirimyces algeriensis]|uniref:Uncharacterized protein n=1 Tax=Melghirimyces algeriensis TaxID=910412 RepID=A0A521CKB6_9BACL|nr:hypothetical protein [Melghirimyces algeriensis]SMO59845.1 hypothetical protein SAMN06264849_10443 [Melghirimyces algeriensis]